MKKNLTELVFILDRSGSMAGLEKDTIGGFNAMIEKQRGEPGEALISTVLFDNETEVIHDRIPLDRVPALTEKEYFVRGCTALLDAVGGAIHHIGNVHKYAREEDRPEKTLFVITTDGMENASHFYTYDQVKAMIQRQQEKYGWEFLSWAPTSTPPGKPPGSASGPTVPPTTTPTAWARKWSTRPSTRRYARCAAPRR